MIGRYAELGVILLLFTIGLEISFRELLTARRMLVLGGTLQILLTVGAVVAVALFLGLPPSVAVVFGVMIALSSTTIVMSALQERGETGSPHGRFLLSVLIFQDLAVVPFMLLLPLLAGGAPPSPGGRAALAPPGGTDPDRHPRQPPLGRSGPPLPRGTGQVERGLPLLGRRHLRAHGLRLGAARPLVRVRRVPRRPADRRLRVPPRGPDPDPPLPRSSSPGSSSSRSGCCSRSTTSSPTRSSSAGSLSGSSSSRPCRACSRPGRSVSRSAPW